MHTHSVCVREIDLVIKGTYKTEIEKSLSESVLAIKCP